MMFPMPRFCSAGRFISRGHGRHSTRRIDSCELIYVLSGCLSMFEEEKSFLVHPGERFFLFPGRLHGGLTPYSSDLSFFWMHFIFPDHAGDSCLMSLPQCSGTASEKHFRNYIQTLLAEQQRETLGKKDFSRTNLNLLTWLILEECTRESPARNPELPRLVSETDRYITLHFDESLTTSEIAGHLLCHPDYLSRLYHQARGHTIGDEIRRRRIQKACHLLENSPSSIKQIAYESGFNDVSYFRKQFMRDCGMTPGAYRKLRRTDHINTE